MSPEDRNQEVNIPIEEDRLVDLLVYTTIHIMYIDPRKEGTNKKMSACISKKLEITIDKNKFKL